MTPHQKLQLVKLLHTLIWLCFNVVIFYLLYAAISNKISKWVWISIAIILAEGLVLLAFKNVCPVTIIARRYSTSTKDNFDIFLPNWLAKYNKKIYTVIVAAALVIIVYRVLTNR